MEIGNRNQWIKCDNSNDYAHLWLKKFATPLRNGKWILFDAISCFGNRNAEIVSNDAIMAYGL